MGVVKNIINYFKHIVRCYKLGRHILKNLHELDDFDCGYLLKKQSNYIPEYLGKIHTISYINNGYFTECSVLKMDN